MPLTTDQIEHALTVGQPSFEQFQLWLLQIAYQSTDQDRSDFASHAWYLSQEYVHELRGQQFKAIKDHI